METVAEARSIIEAWKPHLLLVNIDAENGRAIQLIGPSKGKNRHAVIALTRRADLRGKLDAFERGADDYITAPLMPDDLIARTRAVLRRTHGDSGSIVPRLRVGDLEVDVLRKVVAAQGLVLHLTSLEQALLYLFVANSGTVLTREQILDAIWGTDFVSEGQFVDRYVRALRTKLQDDERTHRHIETVRGVGYRFVPGQTDAPSGRARPVRKSRLVRGVSSGVEA